MLKYDNNKGKKFSMSLHWKRFYTTGWIIIYMGSASGAILCSRFQTKLQTINIELLVMSFDNIYSCWFYFETRFYGRCGRWYCTIIGKTSY